ncbi:MAG: hypothetical protein H7Z19_11285 [Chitinophagaceae bacterium]|nr:hypothetical protein [Rubrivivax sp.]
MPHFSRLGRHAMAGLALGSGLLGCSPTLDWRELRPDGSGALFMLPCKPTPQVRGVKLAGATVRLSMHACTAGGQTWALAFADIVDPALVSPALVELAATAAANLGAPPGLKLPLRVAGATPQAASQRLLLAGQLPDGQRVEEQVAVFSRGTMIYQATVIGQELPAEGVETFFSALRLGP